MKIDTRIAFSPDGNLGAEYNRIIEESNHEWILFIDHDVLLLNPHWYLLCTKAIEQHPETGLFTCYTNNIGGPDQKAHGCPGKEANIMEHRLHAKQLFETNQFNCSVIDGNKCSGMFLLINKSAWKAVGGFNKKGLFKLDWDFGRAVQNKNYKVMRIDGLYVYHIRDRALGSWIEGIKTSKEVRDERMKHKDKRRKRR